MLHRGAKSLRDYDAKEVLEDLQANSYGNEPLTAEQALQCLFDSERYYKYNYKNKRTSLNRFNMIWVWPVFICCVPVQWLVGGNIGITKTSKIGKIVDKLIRLD